jgi:hypothetical protein
MLHLQILRTGAWTLCLTSKQAGYKFVSKHSNKKYTGLQIRVITKLPNSEQSYKGKVKTHNYINRQILYLNTVIVTAGTFEP